MKVIFDHQIFSLQKNGGISRYINCLCHELRNLGVDARIRVSWSENVYVPQARKLPKMIPWKIRQLSYFILNNLCDILFLEKDIDVLHLSYYNSSPLIKNAKKIAVTVHDLIPEDGYQKPSLLDNTVNAKKYILSKVDIVITVSLSTKKRLIHHYKELRNKKIQVIYHGVDIDIYNHKAIYEKNLNDKFILFVGQRDGYKNFIPYLQSIKNLLISNEIKLVAFGGGSFNKKEELVLKKLKLKDKVVHLSGDDATLALYYSKALFLVYPSLSEGFGLPIIEAMKLGCPVLTSNCGSMKEIAADSALLFNPKNANDMLEKTKMILGNAKLLKTFSNKGIIRASNFTWKKTAILTKRAYEAEIL